ncbi:MAG: hypothetical protein JL50_04295 [Peptococcaceae bacterium BICA1-7]|nr:MAG: hypothetical protein JL50_04295 [Peptococcaceae bacterium BICA1-7]HBV95845.1 hypothetical protein [Desulfotomaculum sp.]
MAITMTHEDIEGIQNLIGRMRRENQALRMAAKDALVILEAEMNNRPVNKIAVASCVIMLREAMGYGIV